MPHLVRVVLLGLEHDPHAPFADLPDDPKPTDPLGREQIAAVFVVAVGQELGDTGRNSAERIAGRGVVREQRVRERVEGAVARRLSAEETIAALLREIASAREEIDRALVSIAVGEIMGNGLAAPDQIQAFTRRSR